MTIEWLVYPALGLVAGLLAGLLGVGGGLILVAALAWILPHQGVPREMAMHAALATSLACIVATATASTLAHHRRGSVLWPTVAWLLPGVLVGGWLGSRIAGALGGETLRWLVVGYCLVAAVQLSAGSTRSDAMPLNAPRGAGLSLSGAAIGLVSALVGIGGGSMTVPLLVWMKAPPVRAVGTSSACGIGIGLAAALGYATLPVGSGMPPGSWGYVVLPAALGVAAASLLAAPVGARLAHRLSGKALQRVFAAFLGLVAIALAGGQ